MSTTRETGTVIGNGLKTIFSRMTTSKPAIDALASVGVSIHDLGGNVKPVSEILGELAGKWNNLTKEQQQNVGVNTASRFQLTRFLALMNNWKIATDATNTSINSQGSSMKEQEKYSDSLAARINRLDTAWSKLTLSFGKAFLTDSIIGGVEAFNDMATSASGLVDKVGVLSGVFGILGVTTLVLNTKFRTFSTSMIFGAEGMTRAQLASAGLTAGMTRLGIATVGLKTAFRGLVASTVVGAVFVALGWGIEKLIGAYSKAKQAQEDFDKAQQKDMDALTAHKDETQKLISEYENLSEAKKSQGDNWSARSEQQYLDVQQKLAELYPSLIAYVDGAGKQHIKSKEQIDEEVKATERLILAKKQEMQLNAQDTFNDKKEKYTNNSEDIKAQIKLLDDLKKKKVDANKAVINNHDATIYNDNYFSSQKDKDKAIAEAETKLRELQKVGSDTKQSMTNDFLKISDSYTQLKMNPTIKQSVDDFFASFDPQKLDSTNFDDFAKKYGILQDELQRAYDSGDEKGFKNAQNNLKELAKDLGATKLQASGFSLSMDDIKKSVDNASKNIFAGRDGFDGLDDSVQNATDGMNGLTDSTDQANNAMEMIVGTSDKTIQSIKEAITTFQFLSDQQNLSADQAQSLADATAYLTQLYPSLAKNGELNVIQMRKEVEAQEILMQSLKDITDGKATAEQMMTTNQALASKNRLDIMNAELKAYETMINQEIDLANQLNDDERLLNAQRLHVAENQKKAINHDEIDKVTNSYENQIQKLAEATNYQGQYYKAADKSNSDATYTTDKYKQAIESLDLAISKLKAIQDGYPNTSQQYQNALKSEITLLDQKKKLILDQTKALQDQIRTGNVIVEGKVTKSSSSSTTSSTDGYTGTYSSYINQASSKYGVDPNLVAAIIKNESSFNQNARSRAGAIGLMQLMPSTAKGLGVNPNDAYQNIMGGTKYIAQLLTQFGGNLTKAIEAYNAGAGRVNSGKTLPLETQNYVKKVLASYNAYGGGTSSTITSTSTSAADKQKAIDDAKSQVNQLQQDLIDVQTQIGELNLSLIKSVTDEQDRKINSYKDDMSNLDLQQSKVDGLSQSWRNLEVERTREYQKQKEYQQQAITYLNEQYRVNKNLTSAQKAQIAAEVMDRTDALHQLDQSIIASNQKVKDSLNSIGDQTIDALKAYYQQKEDLELKAKDKEIQSAQDVHDAKVKLIDDDLNAYKNAANDQLKIYQDQNATSDYNTELASKQKDRQKLVNEINKLSLDDSMSGQAKLADLKDQLSQKDLEITQFTTNRQRDLLSQSIQDNITAKEDQATKDKQIQDDSLTATQKRLNDEKQAIQDNYDNILNDERNFAKIRQDILDGNTTDLKKTLTTFIADVSTNMSSLGTSIQANLIDKIANANKLVAGITNVQTTTSTTSTPSTQPSSKPSTPSTPTNTQPKPTPPPSPRYYTVAKGDTYESIAKKYYGDANLWQKIRNANSYDPKKIPIGAKLLIPFDTGGLTDDWAGNSGKLALLHKKELVLNQDDTKNFLSAVKIFRPIVDFIKKPIIPNFQPSVANSSPSQPISITIENLSVAGGQQGFDQLMKAFNNKFAGKGLNTRV